MKRKERALKGLDNSLKPDESTLSAISKSTTRHMAELMASWRRLPKSKRIIFTAFHSAHKQNQSEMESYVKKTFNEKYLSKSQKKLPDISSENLVVKQLLRSNNINESFKGDEPYTNQPIPEEEGVLTEISLKELSYKGMVGSIFISDLQAANNLNLLRRHKITAILSIGINKPTNFSIISGGYCSLDIHESKPTKLGTNYKKLAVFIRRNLVNGNVLVHDFYGTSRACAVVAAFIISITSVEVSDAVRKVSRYRKSCHIGENLLKELRLIKRSNHGLLL